MVSNQWVRVTRKNPCPVCKGVDNCTKSRDGSVVWCGRVSEGSIKTNNGGQHLHRRGERDDPLAYLAKTYRPPKKPKPSPTKDWSRIADEAYQHPSADTHRRDLAGILGVDADALRRLRIGWMPTQRCWTVPERDSTGGIIGINCRYLDGSKKRMAGGQAGLTFEPEQWSHSLVACDHIFLVEGGSDVATLLTIGLCAVGRPSNVGGVELLAELLATVPTDRLIVVLAENDRKPHDSLKPTVKTWHKPDCNGCSACFPGWFGATTTATQLAERLDREIAWTFPPDGAKDVRAWLNNHNGQTE